MGAVGVGLLAKAEVKRKKATSFKGLNISNIDYKVRGMECNDCANLCEVIEIQEGNNILARYGDKCGKWTNSIKDSSKLA